MSKRKRWVGATARITVGVVATAVFATATVSAVAIPWPAHRETPLSVTTLPEPATTVLACSGPLLALGRDAGDATGLADAATPALTAAAAGGAAWSSAALAALDVAGGAGPQTFAAAPAGGARTDLAASGSATASDSDLRGFAASACTPPLMESWLVGGAATTGATDLVVLANPGAVAALVDLTVYGVAGGAVPPAGRGIVVPPGAQRVVPLAALGLGEKSPVVRVTATGAPVQASLQASITRTLVAGGVEQVGVAAVPGTAQVVPAFSVTRAPGAPGASDVGTMVRLLSPSADATATVTITPVGSGVPALEPQTVPLTAGAPLEVELGGLQVGAYTARVESTAPVVAAVWSTTGFVEGADFAWYPAADAVTVPSLAAIADGPAPMLTIANGGDAGTVVRVVEATGAGVIVDLAVPAGGSVQYPVQAGGVYQLIPADEPVHANVTYTGEGAVASFVVTPADTAAAPVVVYPG